MTVQQLEATEAVEPCPVCDGHPRVLVVMRHPAMLRYTRELLERECGCWVATEARVGLAVAPALDAVTADLLVIDAADFFACSSALRDHVARGRVIVIGPEPDRAYRDAALANGAGGWLARDEVADRLGGEMRRVLGCDHDPCPPGGDDGTAGRSSTTGLVDGAPS
jgi:DNA-binding NarL/FixJ family response regulator